MWKTRRRLVIAATVVVCVLGGGVASWASDAALAVQASEHATPRQMTITYLRDARWGNCPATLALTLAHTDPWCNDLLAYAVGLPPLVSYRVTGNAQFVPRAEGGANEECVQSTVRAPGFQGPGIAATFQWGWCWTKTAHGWRLYDQGQG
ncbi:hypothetical protein ACFOYW_14315 [Gryllotalpicola reticulitermitis]|uniref:Uncharacterized protein n=1 Tax=Gryllotalpicola reticulitermitis TaxID=1184153 RepID=A0ABV8QA61_9MICO